MKYSSTLPFSFYHQVSVKDRLKQQIVVGDLSWCERVSSGVVQNMLRSCQTMYMQVQLLKLLCHSKFGFGFTIMGELPLISSLFETFLGRLMPSL